MQGAASLRGGVIDFTGLNGAAASDGSGQSFPWSFGATTGSVTISATWSNLPDQGGPIRTATAGGATLASPFVGTLMFSFSRSVELSLSATFPSLLNDGLDGGRFERVSLSTAAGVVFSPKSGTTAVYTGAGTTSITADDAFSPSPTLSDWGFVGTGLASNYAFVYTSTRTGLSETFDVEITAVPEPATCLLLATSLAGLAASARHRRVSALRACAPAPRATTWPCHLQL
jgi:hypothetical protein